MKKTIAVLAGDGIGQEVVPQAVRVVKKIADKFNHAFIFGEALIGGAAYEKSGTHFPDETKAICQKADAILFGSVGGPVHATHLPQWKNCEKNSILALRQYLRLNINLRPVQIYSELADISPLKEQRIQSGVDFLILRELIGDIYFGEHKHAIVNNQRYASDVAEYNEQQIAAIAHRAFQFARERQRELISVDKANVLETSKLWREIVSEIGTQYPDVDLKHMLVDNCAMQLIINPTQFDVVVTSNLFGDILSDAAAALPGSLGLMPSASLNEKGQGLYEPSGGSAPDIAGKNSANPIGQILSAAMLLRYSFGLNKEAECIEQAVRHTLKAGFRTQDIGNEREKIVNTQQMTDKILSFI